MHEYDLELSAFEGFSINAHANGKKNEYAMYRNTIREGAFANAPMVADPVSLFDNAPDGDGAAAVIITRLDLAQDLVPKPIRIAGSSVATDTFMLQEREDMLQLKAGHISTQGALKQANVNLDAIDLFELHDGFTILAALSLEAAGFAQRGEGWKLTLTDAITLNGRIPISTFGGLKSRGNPAGASGIYQAVEASLQLRDAAEANQVADAKVAMIQNMGGLGSTVATHILRI
jgi:acetyl-CoA C-acetyltransferase